MSDGISHGESQPPHHHRAKSASEIQRDEARVIFDKTIDGQYRHGKTGYRQVGALFLTWVADDMQCKTTEVDKLRDLFSNEFHFKTEYYEIPSDRWETALHKRLADFCYEYDSPDDLAIIYYGGHAYTGEETKQFKLAAKFANDGHGDPTAFFNDIRTCLRLPRCDQLMILDCCYAARAFAHEHIGKRKFELLTSSAHDVMSPAPNREHSFTRTLYEALKRLIKDNPKGFCTSHLYREVYHTTPATGPSKKPVPKPLLFDQARHSYGRIWLRPQVVTERPPKANNEEGRYLKLTFRMNENPDLAVMNELALSLQFLPHVDQIRFDDLYAPKEQIADFMRLVLLASKLKPLVRKMHARRQLKKIRALAENAQEKPPTSLLKMRLENNHRPACDWSSATHVLDHYPDYTHESQDRRKKRRTWPSEQKLLSTNGGTSNGQPPDGHEADVAAPGSIGTDLNPRRVNTIDHAFDTSYSGPKGSPMLHEDSEIYVADRRQRQRTTSPTRGLPPEKLQMTSS